MILLRYAMIVVLLFLVGCAKVEESEFFGTFIVKYPFSTQMLEINKDSTYRQTVIIYSKADTLIHNGKWIRSSHSSLYLINAISSVNLISELDTNPQPRVGYSSVEYYRYFPWSNVRLTCALEGYYYERIE